uniref:Uncharacterized protein n=1 Tax=Pararge aegeria TaxID=116150 RepID=S4P572_9NEOP
MILFNKNNLLIVRTVSQSSIRKNISQLTMYMYKTSIDLPVHFVHIYFFITISNRYLIYLLTNKLPKYSQCLLKN